MRSVIIEGYDGCGKSTLATYLSNNMGLPVYLAGPKPKNLWEIIKRIFEQNKALNDGVIMDRCTPISEAIYGEKTNNIIYKLLTRYFLSKADLVLCVSENPIHVIKQYDTIEHIEFIENNKEKLMNSYYDYLLPFNYFLYDWRKADVDDVLRCLC